MPQWFWAAVVVALLVTIVYLLAKPGQPAEVAGSKSTPPKPTKGTGSSDAPAAAPVPTVIYEEDAEVDPTKVGANAGTIKPIVQAPTRKLVYDEDAVDEEPTRAAALILVTAKAQTDRGLRRKRNEDAILSLPDHELFVVADGMGGYHGGEIASALAVKSIEEAYKTSTFAGPVHDKLPRRASELARAVQMANVAVLGKAQSDKELTGMGTTVCAAHFSPNKQRLYIAHVGDSRAYRLRAGELRQMTSDHTMKDHGITGPGSDHLSRAVGIWPAVPIDIVFGKPHAGDLYLLCSDGLTKMVKDSSIEDIVSKGANPEAIVESLITAANSAGGKDNVSVIVIRVDQPG